MAVFRKAKRAAYGGIRLTRLPVDSGSNREEEDSSIRSNSRSLPHNANVGICVAELAPAFAYEEVPDEVLVGVDLDLSIWSVVARDSCMKRLGGPEPAEGRGVLSILRDSLHPNQLTQIEASATDGKSTLSKSASIKTLNLRGAEHITDQALFTIAQLCPNLTGLDLTRAANLSDAGIRHLVSSCRRLHSLHLSYIPLLRGAALSAIADSHLPIRELSLAGCPRVPEFALQRVLTGCSATLERLDLSFCDDSVADSTLQAVARSDTFTQLQYLGLRGCRQVSDAAVVHIAAACPNLYFLDLTRFDLAYKLNDIALLSIGEKCVLLQTLYLSGCESLTDVGLSWLASGCQALVHLDLGGCSKLTDLSLRAIGENLLRLRHLSLKNCPRISDLGLRRLALGCPELTHLDVSGLVLLSDSNDLSSVAGVAAVATYCPKIHHLDLSRCTSIGDTTLLALASDLHGQRSQLETVFVSGCTRVTSRGVRELLKKRCSHLKAISLQGCTRVDDQAFDCGGRSPLALPLLVVLRLKYCSLLTDVAIQTIAQAGAPLKEVDVSGCLRLTDMAILALCESSATSSSLWSLSLCDLGNITETALSWLAERCPKLVALDLTGCGKIRAFSIQALASSWKFAVFTRGFKGLRPIHRAEDRLFIEEYGKCWRAALRIQSLFRARAARRVAAQRREERLQMWVATKLQSVYRGRQARKLAVLRRLQFDKETHAVRRIQARYRQRLAGREAGRLRRRRHEERRHEAARRLQSAWRRKKLLERMKVRELSQLREETRLKQAAATVQRVWRGKQDRDRVGVLRAAKVLRDQEANEAANKMQNVFRMRAARQEANAKREEKRQRRRLEERAALMLQKHVRRRRAQHELTRRRRELNRLHDSARRIQRRWRAKRRNVALQLVAFTRQHKREHEAAVKLQASWKRKKGRDAARLLRLLKQAQARQLDDAAVRVQAAWRAKVARRQVMQAKQGALERVLQELRMQHQCAALIQAHFRGRRGREQYRALVLERKQQRWKAILHPDTGKPFYYNKETGEVRFRRPQDVLDLLPKPLCDNCVSPGAIAHVECADCGEVFCSDCWGRVHAGGRRKTHAFRVLYDYYGKRVDYDDGEFPSRWPSEILQDEMEGWALRTFPERQPVETRGSWEKYEVVGAQSGGHQWWFYNKETDANSYVPPPQWEGGDRPTGQPARDGGADASGWARHVDEASGYAYYYNAATGESTYERPLSFLTPRESDAFLERSADGWVKYADPVTGAAYYYNAATGESTYARPVSFLTPRRGQAPVEAARRDGWAKYYDDAHGVYYYFNAWTRTSTFERPPQFQTPRVEPPRANQQHVFLDAATQRQYTFDPQTTECRAVDRTTAAVRGYR